MSNTQSDTHSDTNKSSFNNHDEQKAQAAAPLNKGIIIILATIILLMVWYLVADRYTPYTSQARVQTYVVGIAPKVSGLIEKVNVHNNQHVKSGEVLFTIDASNYEIALSKALSDLENTRNQVSAGDAAVDNAKAKLLSAKANQLKAKQDLQRLQRLYKEDSGTISVRRIEVSQANLDQANAGVISANAAIAQAIEQKGGEDSQNSAQVKSAQSAVAKARLDLQNTDVIAQSDGFITNLSADIGQFASAGNPVLTLVTLQDIWINAEFTENNLGNLKIGSSVDILFDAMPGHIFKGKIRSIGVGVSSGKKSTPGNLPSIDNDRDWLRQAQRFPVIIEFDIKQQSIDISQLRVGGQASIVAYGKNEGIIHWLAGIHITIMSWLSYAY